MPNRTARTLAAVCLFALSALGADPAPAGTPTTDKSGKVTVTLPAGWAVAAKAQAAAKPNVTLIVKYTAGAPGKLLPMMTVIASKSHETLDQAAAGLVAVAKRSVPDQGDAGTITAGKVDGEESRVVVTRTLINGNPAERKTVVVSHNGQPYIFDFFCDDAQFKADTATADEVLASIRWK